MDIPQYLAFKQRQVHQNYGHQGKKTVNEKQIVALAKAMKQYLESECVNQDTDELKNLMLIIEDTNEGTAQFLHKLLYNVVENYLYDVLPHNGEYHYDAGICKGKCGCGVNGVVALITQQLLDSRLQLQNIQNHPDHMMNEVYVAFCSKALANVSGNGIQYNFKGVDCSGKPDQSQSQRNMAAQANNMYNNPVQI